jgi:hypothetical protein
MKQIMLVDDKKTLSELVERVYIDAVTHGLDAITPFRGHPGNLALPRKHEIAGVLNRFRNLKIK